MSAQALAKLEQTVLNSAESGRGESRPTPINPRQTPERLGLKDTFHPAVGEGGKIRDTVRTAHPNRTSTIDYKRQQGCKK